ncbi:phospholipase D-like domain-containing protein [Brevundimonas lutea]|uniref:phospholipase D-like domain-containing protein n=1 Tax=Brevundimonas lutea TaxID=2293980 RepID=UPI0013CE8F7D|nr:phospholipase D-like domain-containing protein [Brevundimonas lutea]
MADKERFGRLGKTAMLEAGTTAWRVERADRVALLVDMDPYLTAAEAAMRQARRSIWFLNWAFDPDTPLTPEGPNGEAERMGAFLKRLAAEQPDLDIRILCWDAPLPVAGVQRFFPWRSRRFFKDSRVDFRLDKTAPIGAAHHQKVVVIDDALAFCGSCDIGPDRWDTPDHKFPDPRRLPPGGGKRCYDCRHEIMTMVDGEAARGLGQLFRDRWERATEQTLPSPPDEATTPWPDHVKPDLIGAPVAIARTQAPWRDQPEIREGEAATLAGIAAAKRTLYLENQYFASPIVAEALAQRLEEADGPEIMLVSTQHSPSWFDQMTMDKTRSNFLKRLEESDRHGRLFACAPVTEGGETIIVHAKLMIVDDRYVRLGSSNMNNRSEGFDTECDLIIDAGEAEGDGEACVAVFRQRLIAHWLGVEETVVAKAVDAQGLIGGVRGLEATTRRLRPLKSQALGALAGFIAKHHLGDPIAGGDSLRPWRRPTLMRRKLAEQVAALEAARAPAPDMPEDADALE